ncbi:MAG: hypothetical protein JO069_05995 [Verrucomicrobia bacterium]|nr:hypothetical protein [Verrucomicrobiota bacterium]
MPDLRKRLLSSALAGILPVAVMAQAPQTASPTPTPASPPIPALTQEEMKSAIRTDVLTVPTPGEVFAALDKAGKQKWSSQYRPPTPIGSTSRAQAALNLGTLIADGYIAVQARDAQQVKNIGRDVLALAKKLSVSDSVLARSKSITQFAENGAWDQLDEELAATQNEVKKALEQNRDVDLITLVSVGGWLRGTQVVTGLILQNYNAEDAKLLRQPALVAYLRDKLDRINPKLRDDKLVGQVSQELQGIEKLVSFPADHVPTTAEVRDLNGLAATVTKQISSIP